MSYQTEVLADVPVGYWRLNETSGTVATDTSGNTLDGTYAGTYTQDQVSKSSELGTNVLFTSARISIPDNALLDITGDISVEFWAKFTTSTGDAGIANKWGTAAADKAYWAGIFPTNKFSFLLTEGVTQYSIESVLSTYNDGLWHHVVGTRSGTTLRLYIDGFQVATNTSGPPGLINNSASVFAIGNYSEISAPFAGNIDEAAVYSSVLSPSRVLAHYLAGSAIGAYLELFFLNSANIGSVSPLINNASSFNVPSKVIIGEIPGTGSGVISGVVKENGVAVQGRTVRLYHRPTGQLIDITVSNVSGAFSFSGRSIGVRDYFIVAFDDLNLAPDLNAKIFDRIAPV